MDFLMTDYSIRTYQAGYEAEQARIGREVAKQWVWPFAYDQDDLQKIHSQPDFDPETQLYCFLDDEMVGYQTSNFMPSKGQTTASLDFPRLLHGHDQAGMILLEKALETLRNKGISKVVGRVSSMISNEVTWAEKAGFAIKDWGYKVYYAYPMSRGKLDVQDELVEEINPETDLEACARLASHWYKQSADWCLNLLQEWHQYGIITHLGIRSAGNWVASCMTARNVIRPSTAANFYIFTPDEKLLRPLISRVVNQCVDNNVEVLIADLIHDHRRCEPVYQQLGFTRVAEWGKCEKILDSGLIIN